MLPCHAQEVTPLLAICSSGRPESPKRFGEPPLPFMGYVDHLRRRLAQFKLVAHFLEARSNRFEREDRFARLVHRLDVLSDDWICGQTLDASAAENRSDVFT
jgi:hypothetical protein